MEAKVCVIGSSPCASETLKNLVLPGIGQFTVVDDAVVEEADFGNNFFLEQGDLGKSRAEAVSRLLQEMNPDVRGTFVCKDLASVLQPEFFRPYALVIACQVTASLSVQLDELCHELGIPLVLVTSVGMVGKLRLHVAEHAVIETKPDSEFGDLRLADPFPELQRFVKSIDIDSLDDAAHAHVPYVVILMRALEIFQEEVGHAPSTREEKDRFKAIISKMSRNAQEQNFAEALSNAYKAWTPYTIPEAAKDVLELRTSNSRSDFWVVAKAVANFARDCGKLPLAGSLPDMTANTEWYTKLQEIYASRASGDCAAISAHLATISEELDLDTTGVSPEYVTRFCKNALNVEVFRFRSLKDELQNPISPEEGGLDLACESEDEDSLIHWYLALRAADLFREKHRHWPGFQCNESACAAEAALLAEEAKQVVESYKADITCDPKMLEEIVRYGGCELHVTSSVLGGIASQEAVKLITKQYSPLNNTVIYDGLHGKMQTLEL